MARRGNWREAIAMEARQGGNEVGIVAFTHPLGADTPVPWKRAGSCGPFARSSCGFASN
jgi:hypothetical protein